MNKHVSMVYFKQTLWQQYLNNLKKAIRECKQHKQQRQKKMKWVKRSLVQDRTESYTTRERLFPTNSSTQCSLGKIHHAEKENHERMHRISLRKQILAAGSASAHTHLYQVTSSVHCNKRMKGIRISVQK